MRLVRLVKPLGLNLGGSNFSRNLHFRLQPGGQQFGSAFGVGRVVAGGVSVGTRTQLL